MSGSTTIKVGGSSSTINSAGHNVLIDAGASVLAGDTADASALSVLSYLNITSLGDGAPIIGGKSYDVSTLLFKSIKGINGIDISADVDTVYISGSGSSSNSGTNRVTTALTDTPTLSDSNGVIYYNSSSNVSVTVNDLGLLTSYIIIQMGIGTVTLVPGPNTTLMTSGETVTAFSTQYQGARITVTSTNSGLCFLYGAGTTSTNIGFVTDNNTGFDLLDDQTGDTVNNS